MYIFQKIDSYLNRRKVKKSIEQRKNENEKHKKTKRPLSQLQSG